MNPEQPRLERVRLLSARFHELQGLRVALAGACMALVVGGYLIATPRPTDNGSMVAMLASFGPVIPGIWWLNRYYATNFGRQVWKSPRYVKLFTLIYFIVASILNYAIPSIPAGTPTVAIVALASLWVTIRDWPWRAYYLGATAAVAGGFIASASGVGLLRPGMTLATLFILLGTSMVVIGVLDHLLLVKLVREARAHGLAAIPDKLPD
jgi:hypothetical protein